MKVHFYFGRVWGKRFHGVLLGLLTQRVQNDLFLGGGLFFPRQQELKGFYFGLFHGLLLKGDAIRANLGHFKSI